jgi:hypothetical protein
MMSCAGREHATKVCVRVREGRRIVVESNLKGFVSARSWNTFLIGVELSEVWRWDC